MACAYYQAYFSTARSPPIPNLGASAAEAGPAANTLVTIAATAASIATFFFTLVLLPAVLNFKQ